MAEQQHRATAGQWASVKAYAHDVVTYSVILELLHRIKALEARNENDKEAWAAMRRAGSSHGERIGALMERIEDLENDRRAILNSSSRPRVGFHDSPAKPNHPEIPDSSLMGRIKSRMIQTDGSTWEEAAASVLAEVATWMTSNPDYHFPPALVFALEREAER